MKRIFSIFLALMIFSLSFNIYASAANAENILIDHFKGDTEKERMTDGVKGVGSPSYALSPQNVLIIDLTPCKIIGYSVFTENNTSNFEVTLTATTGEVIKYFNDQSFTEISSSYYRTYKDLPAQYLNLLFNKIEIKNMHAVGSSSVRIMELEIMSTGAPLALTGVTPADQSTGINILTDITFNFNKSIQSATLTLKQGETVIPHTVLGMSTSSIRIRPNKALEFDTEYTATISNIIFNGESHSTSYSTTFRTKQDDTPLQLVNVIPPSGSEVSSGQICYLDFNKVSLDETTVNASNIYCMNTTDNELIPSTLNITSFNGKSRVEMTLDVIPKNKNLTVFVKGVKDIYGNNQQIEYTITYYSPASKPFNLLSVLPGNNSINSTNQKIKLLFSSPLRIDNLSYSLKNKAGEEISSVPTILGETLFITASFDYNEEYSFSLNRVESSDGEFLENPVTIGFKTNSAGGNNYIEQLIGNMLSVFDNAKIGGILIVLAALTIGLIFIGAVWLWKKLKQWLKKS